MGSESLNEVGTEGTHPGSLLGRVILLRVANSLYGGE